MIYIPIFLYIYNHSSCNNLCQRVKSNVLSHSKLFYHRKGDAKMEKRYEELKKAEKGAIRSIVAYIFLSLLKIIVGNLFHSVSMLADGFNNLTDVISSTAILIGLRTARRPADDDHPYGHWKAETISSMITSFIMLLVGFQLSYSSIKHLFTQEQNPVPDSRTALVGAFATIVMFCVYYANNKLAKEVRSSGLKAAAKDNLADALVSLGTSIAILGSIFKLYWLDSAMAIIVSLIILKNGFEIFRDSSFNLSDGFDTDELETYRQNILTIPDVLDVGELKARSYGTNIYVDVTIKVAGSLSVEEGHRITEEVEELLLGRYGINDIDVHVEPIERYQTDS